VISTASFRAGRLLNECADSPDDLTCAIPLLDNKREAQSSTSRKFGGSALSKAAQLGRVRDCRCNRLCLLQG